MTNAATLALLPTVVTPTTTGRLGIETTTPGSVLDVNGIASFRSAMSVAGGIQSATVASNGAVSGTLFTATGTDTIAKFTASPASIAATSYNYVIRGTNDTGDKLVCFVNGSTRTADGGANSVTIRNDGGPFNLGLGTYASNLIGSTINLTGATTTNSLFTVSSSSLSAGVRYLNTVTNRDYRIIQKDAGYLAITDETAGAERLTISNAGVVTIGGTVNGGSFTITADTNNRFQQGAMVLRSGSPTVYFRDTDQMSAMLHNNSNLFYVLRGGVDTETWTQINGQWPAYWDLSNNNALFGGALSAVGEVTAYASDLRLKENIKNIPDALNKVLRLNGVTFSWMDKTKDIGFCVPKKDDIGVIAQEVQDVLPEAVKFAPFDRDEKGNSRSGENYLTVQYEKLTALLIEAVKDQQKMIDDLRDRLSALESQIAK